MAAGPKGAAGRGPGGRAGKGCAGRLSPGGGAAGGGDSHLAPGGAQPAADFFLTRVLGRTAVPFFFMVTGRFALSGPEAARRFCRKTLLLYGAASALYLPLAWYAGRFQGLDLGGALKLLVWDGIYYHLWYLPACLMGMGVAWALRGLPKGAGLAAASVLYLLGLLGDAYWGLTEQIPWLEQGYQLGFRVFTYTRNGLFMAPFFLLLGRALGDGRKLPGQSACLAGALAGLAAHGRGGLRPEGGGLYAPRQHVSGPALDLRLPVRLAMADSRAAQARPAPPVRLGIPAASGPHRGGAPGGQGTGAGSPLGGGQPDPRPGGGPAVPGGPADAWFWPE